MNNIKKVITNPIGFISFIIILFFLFTSIFSYHIISDKTYMSNDQQLSLSIKNDINSVNFSLTDLSVIAEPTNLKYIPTFDTKVKITSNFIDTFIKGKGALPEAKTFTVLEKNGVIGVIINYSTTNTHRVNIPSETVECNLTKPISFNANLTNFCLSISGYFNLI